MQQGEALGASSSGSQTAAPLPPSRQPLALQDDKSLRKHQALATKILAKVGSIKIPLQTTLKSKDPPRERQ